MLENTNLESRSYQFKGSRDNERKAECNAIVWMREIGRKLELWGPNGTEDTSLWRQVAIHEATH